MQARSHRTFIRNLPVVNSILNSSVHGAVSENVSTQHSNQDRDGHDILFYNVAKKRNACLKNTSRCSKEDYYRSVLSNGTRTESIEGTRLQCLETLCQASHYFTSSETSSKTRQLVQHDTCFAQSCVMNQFPTHTAVHKVVQVKRSNSFHNTFETLMLSH